MSALNDGVAVVRQILEGTVSSACQHLSMLQRLIDGLALLDMLASFALAVRPAVSLHNVVVKPATQIYQCSGSGVCGVGRAGREHICPAAALRARPHGNFGGAASPGRTDVRFGVPSQ